VTVARDEEEEAAAQVLEAAEAFFEPEGVEAKRAREQESMEGEAETKS